MSKDKPGGRVPRPVRRMGTETIRDRRTRRERDRGASERAAVQEGREVAYVAYGRVPGPWRDVVTPPYPTRAEAAAAGRERRLGGLKVREATQEEVDAAAAEAYSGPMNETCPTCGNPVPRTLMCAVCASDIGTALEDILDPKEA